MSESKEKSSLLNGWVIGLYLLVAVILAIIPKEPEKQRGRTAITCIDTLRQIDAAARGFALEKSKKSGDAINYPDDLTPYIKLNEEGKIPPCLQGGVYTIKKVGDKPTCSLSNTVTPAHVLP